MKITQSNPQSTQPKPRSFEDFSDEYEGKLATIRLYDNSTLYGRILKVSKYFVKLQVGTEVLYINKAYVVSIKP